MLKATALQTRARALLCTVLLGAGVPPIGAAARETLDRPPLPPELRTAPVADSLAVDGLHLRALAISARTSVPATAGAIERHWTLSRPRLPIVRSRVGEWLVLGRGAADEHETVQLRATESGTEGFYAVRRAAAAPAPVAPPLPLPRGSLTLLGVDSASNASRARQTVVLVSAPPPGVAAELRANARRAGWREQSPANASALGSPREPRALRFVRSDLEELLVAVVPLAAGTGLVVQHVQGEPP